MAGPNLHRIAWRNLWRNRRRTLLTLASIAFGGFLSVLMTAMQDRSFADMIDHSAQLGGGHVGVQEAGYLDAPSLTRSVEGAEELADEARALPHVDYAVVRIEGQAMAATAASQLPAFVIAYDPTVEDGTTLKLIEGLVDGRWLETKDEDGVVIGKELAEQLEAEIGDKVVYTMIDKNGEIASGLARIRGLVGTGAPSLDSRLMMLPIDRVRQLLAYAPDEATRVSVVLDDFRRSEEVAGELQAVAPAGSVALTWDQLQPDLNGFIAMKVGGARFMEGLVMVLVAASIFNTLFVSVLEREREFGILLAIGWSPWQIFRLVVWESSWLGAMGVVMAAMLTAPVYAYLWKNPIDVSGMTGGQSMEISGVGFEPLLRIGIFPENAVIIAVALVVATVAAGLFPAIRAGRTEPVDAIRYV